MNLREITILNTVYKLIFFSSLCSVYMTSVFCLKSFSYNHQLLYIKTTRIVWMCFSFFTLISFKDKKNNFSRSNERTRNENLKNLCLALNKQPYKVFHFLSAEENLFLNKTRQDERLIHIKTFLIHEVMIKGSMKEKYWQLFFVSAMDLYPRCDNFLIKVFQQIYSYKKITIEIAFMQLSFKNS